MTTHEHPWRERRGSGTVIVANKELSPGIENPYASVHLRDEFLDEAEKLPQIPDNGVALTYLVEEYVDDALEDLEEMGREELIEMTKEMEDDVAKRLGKVKE